MRTFSTCKKGQIGEIADVIFVPFALAMVFIIVAIMFDQVNTGCSCCRE